MKNHRVAEGMIIRFAQLSPEEKKMITVKKQTVALYEEVFPAVGCAGSRR